MSKKVDRLLVEFEKTLFASAPPDLQAKAKALLPLAVDRRRVLQEHHAAALLRFKDAQIALNHLTAELRGAERRIVALRKIAGLD